MTGADRAELGTLAWPDVPPRRCLVVTLGATEQHGPHLPLSTDTLIAAELAARLVDRHPAHCLLGPVIPVGASGEHQAFAGTLSIGTEALEHLLVELVRSAAHSFAGVVLVNGHGGNHDAVAGAARLLRSQEHRVMAWAPSVPPGGDLHAGRTETAVLMALAPHLVHGDRVAEGVSGAVGSITELLPAMRSGGVAAVSPNGVLGDPSGATAEQGVALLGAWEASLVGEFERWRAGS